MCLLLSSSTTSLSPILAVQTMVNLFPLMPAHLRPAFKRLISAIPEPWLLALKSGKIFELEEICKKHLQAFALAQGFAVVVGKSRNHSGHHNTPPYATQHSMPTGGLAA